MRTKLRSSFSLCAALALASGAAAAPGDDRGMTLARDLEAANSEARIALVIGNSKYADAPLENPVNDASDVAAALRKLRFDVSLQTNVDQERMDEAIKNFGKRLSRGGVGLFYYAGHGMQVDGRNFLIPVGARIEQEKDVKYKAVDLGQVLDEFEGAQNRLNILILDACRDNPFRGTRGGTRGLAKTDAPRGTIVAYATAPGSVAADGSGRNGIYTQHLLSVLPRPGMPIEQVFKEVRKQVVSASRGLQTPWESSSLTGDFEFLPSLGPAPGAASAPAPPPLAAASSDEVIRENKRRWELWLKEMRSADAQAGAFERAANPPDLKAQMWLRFGGAFAADDPYSAEDEKLRAKASERAAHWQRQQPANASHMTVDDLETQARDRQTARITQMRQSFEAASAYEKKGTPPDLKAEAWRRFLDAFATDFLGERADDELRATARQRMAHWQAQKPEESRTLGLEDLGDALGAARGTLARYRAAYEARDLSALSAVWVMNPQQRSSMKELFTCATSVQLELAERAIEHDGDMVAIDFDQKVGFSGPQCLMAASGKSVAMTAVIMRTSGGWMISSILPHRSKD